MPRGRAKTWEEKVQEIRLEKERLAKLPPLKSPCLKGRRQHDFGRKVGKIHKQCRWCHKSREQIEVEQKPYKAREKCARGGFGDFFNCIWAYRKNCPRWLQELCEKADREREEDV